VDNEGAPLDSHHDLNTGDPHDDDGHIIDAFFEPNPELKTSIPAGADAIPPNASRIPVLATRMLVATQTLTSSSDPVMLFPEDATRKQLTIRLDPPTSQVVIASDKNGCYWGARASDFYSQDHTGAVWIYGPALAAQVFVSAWSIVRG
jgi:hypothetical protein